MVSILTKIIKRYYIFIFLIVLSISLGQTLFMLPWQDDNALFFKLAHINEPAGFLGPGLFGSFAYKYTAFFYYPIYLAFGHQPFYYFAYGFIFYGISTFLVYKVASTILGRNAGYLVGFLYACGFIGSDSFIRIFNSVVASISIILVLLFIYSYWKFVRFRKNLWYFGALFFFFLAAEFAKSRTHYLIAIPILFELAFLSYKKPLVKSIVYSLARISIFLPIFYRYVVQADLRTQNALDFILKLLSGNFYYIYGFLASLTHMFLPELFTKFLAPTDLTRTQSYLGNSVFYFLGLSIFIFIFLAVTIIKFPKTRTTIFVFIFLSIIWKFISGKIFINPALEAVPEQVFVAYLGGELLILVTLAISLVDKKYRALYLLFLGGTLTNLLSYSFYNPLQVYEKINRYFSHSFLFLVFLLALVFVSVKNKKLSKAFLIAAIIWGFMNMIESYSYQKAILASRTQPVKSFYKQLKIDLPIIKKDDILYFDQEDKARGNFADAFSVAQMPETTAIAWRYGIDRYDFKMFQETNEFFDYLKNNKVDLGQIHSFFYSSAGLKDTTQDITSFLRERKSVNLSIPKKDSVKDIKRVDSGNLMEKTSIEFLDKLNIPSFIPLTLVVDVIGTPSSFGNSDFPFFYGSENLGNDSLDDAARKQAFEYKKFKESFRRNEIEASSDWQGRVAKNLTDGDYGSVWEADRLLWSESPQYIVIDGDPNLAYDRLFFINSYSNNTPLEFDILGSNDKSNWTIIKNYQNSQRFKNGEEVIVDFKPQKLKYFKVLFKKTLNTDAPAISELWLVPSKFLKLNLPSVEKFLDNPFGRVSNRKIYDILASKVGYSGKLKVSWANNKNYGWQNSAESFANIIFDGKIRRYEIPIVPGGTLIDKLKFTVEDFPGEISILGMEVRY